MAVRPNVIGYLGPPSPHYDALREVVHPTGGRVVYLPDSAAGGCYGDGWVGKASRWAAQLRGTRNGFYLAETLAALDRERVEVILAYWGTNPLPDIRAIAKARPNLPIVLMALCHPTGLTPRRIALQNWNMRRAAPLLRGVVYPSRQMADYFQSEVFGPTGPTGLVIRPCWPSAWHARSEALPADGPTPSLIFLGRMDGGQPCDDVRDMITSVARCGVHVSHVTGRPIPGPPDPYRQTFPPDTVPKIIQRASGFDAALVWYNTQSCTRTERFANTVPDRLVSAVAAGVPVAVPRYGFDACHEYLADYPAVIPFDTAAELAANLRNRELVTSLRAAGRVGRENYRAEDEWGKLARFLDWVVGSRREAG